MTSVRIASACAAVVCILAGCHSVKSVEPAQLRPSDGPQRLWVTMQDQSVMALDMPEVNGDTLTGMLYGEPQTIPLSQTTKLMALQPAHARTALLVGAAGVALLGGFMYMQSRPDVGDARYCSNLFGNHPAPYTPCCSGQDPAACP